MSVSAIFGTRIAPTPFTIVSNNFTVRNEVKFRASTSGVALIECSSRPQKKATAHHKKTRPKKTQPWDIRRGPTAYAPLPPLPPEWSLVSSASEVDDSSSDVAAADVGVGSTLTAE